MSVKRIVRSRLVDSVRVPSWWLIYCIVAEILMHKFWIGQYHPVGHDSVRLGMNAGGYLGARSVNEAPRLLLLVVEPIGEVLHAVRVLDRQVSHVSSRKINRADTAEVFMAIKVNRHLTPFQMSRLAFCQIDRYFERRQRYPIDPPISAHMRYLAAGGRAAPIAGYGRSAASWVA